MPEILQDYQISTLNKVDSDYINYINTLTWEIKKDSLSVFIKKLTSDTRVETQTKSAILHLATEMVKKSSWDQKKETKTSPTQAWWKEQTPILNQNTLKFFSINNLNDVQKNLTLSGLDFEKPLSWYKNFIEIDLQRLPPQYKEKIKTAIRMKLGKVNTEIENLKKEEMDRFWNLDKFKENRWIINEIVEQNFSYITNKVLPSAYFLTKYDKNKKYTDEQKKKIEEINEMFHTRVSTDGDFYEGFFSTQNTFDISNTDDSKFLSNLGLDIYKINNTELLNEKDKDIQNRVNIWTIAFLAFLLWSYLAPQAWAVINIWYFSVDSIDSFFRNEKLDVTALKIIGVIPQDYRGNITIWDKITSVIWVLPVVWLVWKGLSKISIIQKLIITTKEQELFLQITAQIEKFFSEHEKISKVANVTTNIWKRMVWYENKGGDTFILEQAKKLKSWEKISIDGVEVGKVKWWYKVMHDWTPYAPKNIRELWNVIKGVDDTKKINFIIATKKAHIFKTMEWKERTIGDYIVTVENGAFKVKDKKSSILLKEDGLNKFLTTYNDEILSKFLKVNKKEVLKEIDQATNKTVWNMTVWQYLKNTLDYIDKAWFKNGSRSKLKFKGWNWWERADALGGILLTPATTMKQLISAIMGKNWKDLIKVIFLGNKNYRLKGDWWRRWFVMAWPGRMMAISTLAISRNMDQEWNTNFWKIIAEIALLNYLWIIDTYLLSNIMNK